MDLRLLEAHIDHALGTNGLHSALSNAKRPVAFMVGSALSMPRSGPGVPGVAGVIKLVEEEVGRRIPDSLGDFRSALSRAAEAERYAVAMRFLLDSIDQDAVNEVIRRAVRQARTAGVTEAGVPDAQLEARLDGWEISPATAALAELVVAAPDRFPGPVVTTNFDPLLGIAIRRAGGRVALTALDGDGRWSRIREDPEGGRVDVVHLHGYWQGSETLHTPLQLQADRPRLRAELQRLLREHLVAVIGYGGWDDVFTGALAELVEDSSVSVEVVWAFFENDPVSIARRYERLFERLNPILMLGRFRIYRDVDCHELLPNLLRTVRSSPPPGAAPSAGHGRATSPSPALAPPVAAVSPTSPVAESSWPLVGVPAPATGRLTAEQQALIRSACNRLGSLVAKVEAGPGSGSRTFAEHVIALKASIVPDAAQVLDSLQAVDAGSWPDTRWAVPLGAARGAAGDALRQLREAVASGRPDVVDKRERALRRVLVRLRELVAQQCPDSAHP